MAGKTSKSQTAYYARYKTSRVWETNRKRRLERTLKAQPNNEQVKQALKGMVYRRKTPTNRPWSASWVRVAKILKEFTGRCDPGILSSNVETARIAMQKPGTTIHVPMSSPFKSMFSIEARLYKGPAK
jgi:hypothetical protein